MQQISWEGFMLLGLQRSSGSVSIYVAVLLGDLHAVGSVALSASEELPCVQWILEALRLWCLQRSR